MSAWLAGHVHAGKDHPLRPREGHVRHRRHQAGDIGSTAEAYADAWLGVTKVGEALCGGFNADCVTLNGYMGADSVNPFLKVAGERDKSVFILPRPPTPLR